MDLPGRKSELLQYYSRLLWVILDKAGLQWLGIVLQMYFSIICKNYRAFKASLSTIDILSLRLHVFWTPATWGFWQLWFILPASFLKLKNCQSSLLGSRKHRKSVADLFFLFEPWAYTVSELASPGGFSLIISYFIHVLGAACAAVSGGRPSLRCTGSSCRGLRAQCKWLSVLVITVTVAPWCWDLLTRV